MRSFLADVRQTTRALVASPGLIAVSVLSLGLGVGVNLALFMAARAIFFYEPHVADVDRVVAVQPGNSNQYSFLNYRDLRDSGIFESLAGSRQVRLNLSAGRQAELVDGLAVTPEFFQFVGVRPALGRAFTAAEADPGRQPRIAVLSDAFWRRRFDADPDMAGRELVLDDEPYSVVGVLPSGYLPVTLGADPDVYLPITRAVLPTVADRRNSNALAILARLRPGMNREQAQAAVTAFGGRLEAAFPRENEGMGRPARVLPVQGGGFAGSAEQYTVPVVMLSLFGLVLLIACANVAGLLMTRSARRQQEIAVRLAMGASKVHIARLLLIESFGLGIMGTVAGALLALLLTRILAVLSIPGAGAVTLSAGPSISAAIYTTALLMATGLLCGLAPALRLARANVSSSLQGGDGRITARLWLRHAVVIGQVAACLVLLVLSSLMLRSLFRVTSMDPGFDVDHGLVANVHVKAERYGVDGGLGVGQQIVERLTSLPGVRSASLANMIALGDDRSATRLQVEGFAATGARTFVNSVSPGHFDTLGIPVVRGRDFDPRDVRESPPVAVVTDSFARAYFPGQDALGKRVRESEKAPYFEIVGIVRDHMYGAYGDSSSPVFYMAYAQQPRVSTQVRPVMVHVRTTGNPAPMTRAVATTIAEVDPTVSIGVQTLREAIGTEPALRRTGTQLLASAGGVGLLLAMIGLYGLMAFAVASRVPEIGIRMALGAAGHVILRSTLTQGLKLIGIGIAIGTVASLLIARAAVGMLAGLSAADPMAFGGAALVLVLVGLAACYSPARRAARLDPLVALRRL